MARAFQLYLAVEDVNQSRIKANQPSDQRYLRTVSQDPAGQYYNLLFRNKLYRSLEKSQVDLGRLAGELQPGATSLGPVLLQEDLLGDLPAQQAPGR